MAAIISRRWPRMQGWDLEAVLNNDIVGGDKSAEQDHSVVRVFSEGVPVAATEQDIRRIRGLGRRERFRIAGTGAVYRRCRTDLRRRREADADLPAGSILARRRSLFVQPAGIRGGAADGVSRRLSSSAPECAHGKRHRVWRSAEVCGLRLRGARGAAECGDAGVVGGGAGASGECASADQGSGE